ncbi:MAG: pantoate--beta-alanine ligase [Bacteroidales bacterium]
MEIIYNPGLLVDYIHKLTQDGSAKIGFVPTMGALHNGHLSLVRKARQENDICVVSIFVNPTQFNDKEDFEKYPRSINNDLRMLQDEGVDVVFMPHENDVYPTRNLHELDLGGMDKIMEGKFRPGHFDGVADVVYRFFNMVKPDRAYFGNKDFQQLKVIEAMAKNENLDVEVIGAPIVREPDGLAMSSRNQRLSTSQRKNAADIYKVLKQAADVYASFTPEQLKNEIARKLNNNKFLECEYVEIVREKDLKHVKTWKKGIKMRICVAVWCGNVRLIDNYKIVT